MSNELYNNTNIKIFSNNLFEFSCYDTSAIIIKVKNTEIESVNVPEYFNNEGNIYKVIAIGKKAFENFKKLTTVTLPNSVIIIDDEAFNNCYNIESINIDITIPIIEVIIPIKDFPLYPRLILIIPNIIEIILRIKEAPNPPYN
jgi:hypothetical protein